MTAILNLLSQGWIGTIVGLGGIVLAIVFYLRSRRMSRIAFQHDHVMLVGGRGAAFPAEVEIRFSGTVVPRITASTIVIWNCGDRTIRGSDLVDGDPLRVDLTEGGIILKHAILRQTRSVNAWNITQPSPNRIALTFDFLDPGDGITIEVIHSQPASSLDLLGTIRGIPKGLLDYGSVPWSVYSCRRPLPFPMGRPRIILLVAVAFGILMILYGLARTQLAIWFPSAFGQDKPVDGKSIRWVFVIMGTLYASFPGFMLWIRRRRYPPTLEPDQDLSNKDTPNQAL